MNFLRRLDWKQVAPAALLALVIGGGAGFYLHTSVQHHSYRSFRDTDSGYEYIAPLLFVSIDEEQSFPRYRPLKNAMQEFADRAIREKRAEDVSIYFRNLNTSQWVGVNPDVRYAPASMFKVATLISALSAVQENPSLLSLEAYIGGALADDETQKAYPPKNPVLPGNSYSVKQLLEHLVRESDNVANVALTSFAGEKRIQEVYEELELIPVEDVPGEGYTAQEYSRLYRTLYNSTYLSRAYSDYALSLLASTSFTQGIVQGVPEGTRVAHKFGVRTGDTNELHDCGIVYHSPEPYFICVMTRGDDLTELEQVLADASRAVWEEVSALAENP